MQLVIVLPLRNQAELNQFLHDLYDPAAPRTGNSSRWQSLRRRFGPSQENYDAVIVSRRPTASRWLAPRGIA